MAKFTIYNTLLADEAIESVTGRDGIARYNAGAETGPYPVKTKFNNIAVPLPRTNLKVTLVPGATAGGDSNPAGSSFEVETEDLVEIEFFRVLGNLPADENGKSITIPGIVVVETPADNG